MMTMLRAIFQQELQQQLRNRVMQFLLPGVMLLTLLVAVSHWYQQQVFDENQQYWQNQNDQAWLTQPDRHPHRAAHYGNLVYRPPAALAFIDAGVEPYIGNALFLEAHRQNSANFRQFSHSQSYMQLGYLSAATIVLVLWPLVLVALGYSALSREQEAGTLKQLVSLGVKPGHLLLGKGLVYLSFSLAFLLWVFAIASFFVISSHDTSDSWSRLALLFCLYLGYCCIWISFIMLASYWFKRSSKALAWTIIAWVFTVVILPKVSVLVADSKHPLPARSVYEVQTSLSIAKVGDSHNPNEPYFSEFRNSVLNKYGADKVEDLPVNWRGLVMAEGEKISSEVFQQHYKELLNTMDAQRKVAEQIGSFSPYLIVAQLSKRLAGTDATVFYGFEQQAEAYRYGLIQHLNHLHQHEIKLKDDRAQRLDKSHWRTFDSFQFDPLLLKQNIEGSYLLVVGLLLWLFAGFSLIRLSWNRVVS